MDMIRALDVVTRSSLIGFRCGRINLHEVDMGAACGTVRPNDGGPRGTHRPLSCHSVPIIVNRHYGTDSRRRS